MSGHILSIDSAGTSDHIVVVTPNSEL